MAFTPNQDRSDTGNHPDSYYAATRNQAPELIALDGSCRTDVAIVGGGYTGLSCAIHLAKRGYKVVLLEARPEVPILRGGYPPNAIRGTVGARSLGEGRTIGQAGALSRGSQAPRRAGPVPGREDLRALPLVVPEAPCPRVGSRSRRGGPHRASASAPCPEGLNRVRSHQPARA